MRLNPKISGSVRICFVLSVVRGLKVTFSVMAAVSLPRATVPSLHSEPHLYICRVQSIGP